MANHSFISYIRNKHSFTLTIFGFSISTSFIVNFKQRVTFAITNMILSTYLFFPLIVRKPVFTFTNSLIKSGLKLIQSFIIKEPVFVFTMKQLIKLVQSFVVRKPVLVFTMRLAEKVPSWILDIPVVTLTLAPLVAKLNLLLTYDPQYLVDLDSQTLSNMDYTV